MPILFPDVLRYFINLNKEQLNELRIRKDLPVMAKISGVWQIATYKGTSITVNSDEIVKILQSACENSIYAYNDRIKQGYVTTKEGIRIGICGKCVILNEGVSTITDYTSLCIRFPKQILGCSNEIFDIITKDGFIENTLIISKPGDGKTTALRDLVRIISNKLLLNVLIIDEREELYSCNYDLGKTFDVLRGCNKKFGFFSGIKNLCPDVIIVDELSAEADIEGIEFAILSGVKVIGSIHGYNYESVIKKVGMKSLLQKNCFKYFITLKRDNNNFSVSEVVYND